MHSPPALHSTSPLDVLQSETTVASARSRGAVGFGAGYFDLSPSMGPFEYNDSGRSGTYQEAERDKGHRKDDGFPHLLLILDKHSKDPYINARHLTAWGGGM